MAGAGSLLETCANCWHRPELLRREVLWRWAFGLPASAIVFHQASRIVAAASLGPESLSSLSLSGPMQAGQQLLLMAAAVADPAQRTALWLGPLLAVAWSICSGLGRNALLRRLDPALHSAPVSLVALQLLRITVLSSACLGWYRALRWAADSTLDGLSPNLVAYSAWVICLSLGSFVLWALVSWIFSIAPLLVMMRDPLRPADLPTPVAASRTHNWRLGAFTGELVEVNLVLGILRLALIVLATVFSAIPLPFEAEMSGIALYLWWTAVALLYFVAGDFFQVVRLAAFVRILWTAHPVTVGLAPRTKA